MTLPAVDAVTHSEQAAVATIATEPTADWDELAVDRAGGHVYQSRAWAAHRRADGWQPLFISVGGLRILALVRPWFLVDGGSAYIPRGPAPVVDGNELGAALWHATVALARRGIDVVAEDAEVPADDAAWREWLRRARYRPIEEIQPSRHRLTLPLAGRDEDAVFGGIAKSTRQRIRKAESGGIAVVRYDNRVDDGGHAGDLTAPAEAPGKALDRFYDLLLETGQRRDFSFGPRASFVTWWTRALSAGHLVFLEARDGGTDGEVLAGLVLYRHGRRLSTVHSGDHAAARTAHPGSLHLLRWRAIQLAISEQATEMDLGGVDVAGARREPGKGEPMFGLYQHKLSFGGRWLQLAGAHERVIRSNRYAAGRLLARARRVLPLSG
jgi:lipid II:glycine glycyltransferase (peptidoglycan interpeptide bridge formation enzyme)